jgi:hypothetical protein
MWRSPAVGDAVNLRPTGRRAGAGEILVCVDTATAVRLDPTLERTRLKLKTKAPANEVVTCA